LRNSVSFTSDTLGSVITALSSSRFWTKCSRTLVVFGVLLALVPGMEAYEPFESAETRQVIDGYLAATRAQAQNTADTMEVNIDANVPKLKKEGKLHALRKISELGKVTYKVLGFQGDDSIKNEVIARYLDAEQKGQDNSQKLAITPENYKFKVKGTHKLQDGQKIYIVFLTPRKKEVGLFKGEMWLDAKTYLPVMESGKLVKNPSVFFKKVEFVRDFAIKNGAAIPQHMESIIEARLIGKVNLTVDYLGYQSSHDRTAAESPAQSAANGGVHLAPSTMK
jgi:hypothetical protein